MKIELDRTSRSTLADQLAAVLKNEITRGKYRPGDVLPGIHDLARAANVSEKVPRQALARLAETGWAVPRRGVGSVVADRGCDVAVKGRVLIYTVDTGYSYYCTSLVATLRSKLVRAGYRLLAVSASVKTEKDGCRQLAEMLKERWDLVLECGYRSESRRLIEASGWPFVVLGDGAKSIPSSVENCMGDVAILCGKAVPDFVLASVRSNVKDVLQFEYDIGSFDVSGMLGMAGVRVRTVRIPRQRYSEEVSKAAIRAVETEVCKWRGKAPDVILFTDDHLAQGGLLALMAHGIRIPEDVRVVSLANKGLGPVWVEPVTRLEMDAFAHGAEIAKAVIAFLGGRPFPQGMVLGSAWKRGKTF